MTVFVLCQAANAGNARRTCMGRSNMLSLLVLLPAGRPADCIKRAAVPGLDRCKLPLFGVPTARIRSTSMSAFCAKHCFHQYLSCTSDSAAFTVWLLS